MSKLAYIKYARAYGSGDIFSSILKIGGGIIKGIGSAFKKAPAAVNTVATMIPQVQNIVSSVKGTPAQAAQQIAGGTTRAAAGYAPRRRGKGITARELRGFRKVSTLLHKEGMSIKKRRK